MRTSTRQAETWGLSERVRERQGAGGARADAYFETPFGAGRLTLTGDLPLELELPGPEVRPPKGAAVSRPARERAAAAGWVAKLEAYFAGETVGFDLDVAAHCRARGMTAFETAVYTALAAVPYGGAVSYRDLAHAAGRPNAYRAVGTAMSQNVLPVILPCHRVIKNDGTPGQYGDDPLWKLRLLELEGTLEPGATKVVRAGRGRGR